MQRTYYGVSYRLFPSLKGKAEAVGTIRYLAPDGTAPDALPALAGNRDAVLKMYRAMVLTRTFDQKAVSLQRTGRLGTYASSLGQEAVTVGLGSVMREDDVLLPSFREQGAQIWRGVKMTEILQYWGGDERGSNFSGPRHDFPVCVPVGSHAPHAAGVALAMKLRGEDRVAVCVLGDGATSKGDFYEALNVAGVWSLPVVFVINNNQWAISVPRAAQSAAPALSDKGVSAGVPGVQVDGNDVFAVTDTVEKALVEARKGLPQLVEALTYRLSDHTTADDSRRYRDEEEVSAAWKNEPIARLRSWMVAQDWWTREDEQALIRETKEQVEAAAEAYLALDSQPVSAMFDHLYETLPAPLAAQRDQAAGGADA